MEMTDEDLLGQGCESLSNGFISPVQFHFEIHTRLGAMRQKERR